MQGLAEFNVATAKLLLGEGSDAVKEGRVATCQGLSGTGSLRVGIAFIGKFLPVGTKAGGSLRTLVHPWLRLLHLLRESV
jgi:aspartate/tyrosine/aromatic aminotransferase